MRARLLLTVLAVTLTATAAGTVKEAEAAHGLSPLRGPTNPLNDTATRSQVWGEAIQTDTWDFFDLWSGLRGASGDPPIKPTSTPTGWDAFDDGRIAKARRAAATLPKMKTLGTLALATTAFSAGWKIGRTIDTQWLHLSGSGPLEDVTWTQLQWKWTEGFNGWVLEMAGTGLTNRSNVPWPATGAGTDEGICTAAGNGQWSTKANCGSQWGTWAAYQTKQLSSQGAVNNGSIVLTATRPMGGANNCGAGDPSGTNFNVCLALYAPELAAEAHFGANAEPQPWVAQASDYTTNITLPSTPPGYGSAAQIAVQAALLEDEADAIAAAGTTAEEATVAFQAGHLGDPEWAGYPLPTFTVPDCGGLTVAQCETELAAAGHTGTVTEDTLTILSAVVTRPAGAVVDTYPIAGATMAESEEIILRVNPDPMPLELPEPLLTETVTAYRARLAALGYLGTVTETILSADEAVPELGPDAPVIISTPAIAPQLARVIRVGLPWPSPTPRVMPDTAISISVNPSTLTPLPTPTPGTVASGPITPGGLDFSPITDIDFGCKFPYGLISCYAIGVTEWFDVAPDAPRFSFDAICVGNPGGGELCAGAPGETFVVDLEVMDEYMSLLRALMEVALWIGTVYLLASRLLGFHAGGDPGEAVDEGLDWR